MAKRKRERRKPGSGYASQAKNSTWTAFYPRFGGGWHVKRGFSTRSAAETWLDSLVTQQANQGDVAGGQQALRSWIDTWVTRAAKEREWKAKTVADVVWKLAYINPYLGDHALVDVLPDQVDAVWDDLRAGGMAENTLRQIRNYLFQVFEEARERRYITYNPVLKPKRRKRARQKPPERLSASQAALIVRSAETSFYALAWWLVLTLGLRAGEVLGLRWGDVDLEAATLHIRVESVEVRGRTRYGDRPKNDKTRMLAVARALLPLFRLQRQAVTRRAAQGVRRGYWKEHGLVFPGRGGRPMNPIALRHQLKVLTDVCQLPPVTTHMLRHTAAKFYIDLGCPDNIVGAILGHAPNITGHYAPPGPEAQRPWVDQVHRQLAGAVEQARAEQSA